jgi:peptide/nickel transport system ATP-binding protein
VASQGVWQAVSLIDVSGLTASYRTERGVIRAVDNVSFQMDPGEALGLIGESGCGKSTLGYSLLRELPPGGSIEAGKVLFEGRDLVALGHEEMRRMRWQKISMIFQGAMNSLNPVYRVADLLGEAVRVHENLPTIETRERIRQALTLAGFPEGRANSYPHELSGGMKQRAVIALALVCNPRLVIADEPTTALDVVVQDAILRRLKRIQRDLRLGFLLISHDAGVVAQFCDRVGVMYAGQIVEIGSTRRIFTQPRHPYSRALVGSIPDLSGPKTMLASIPGSPPDLHVPQPGCRFAPRCEAAQPICSVEPPPIVPVAPGEWSRCHFAIEVGARARPQLVERLLKAEVLPATGDTLVKARGLAREFDIRGRGGSGGGNGRVKAVAALDLDVRRGEILGLVGESGCGKTTTGMLLTQLERPNEGRIEFDGVDVTTLGGKAMRRHRRRAQIVFQDPYESLNPRLSVEAMVTEPLVVQGIGNSQADRRKRVVETLVRVGLTPPERYLQRYGHDLSGGERQRVAIARAIVLSPEFLVADEPVSMLDVSVRAGVLNLMLQLRDELKMTYVFITHDLAVAHYVCDRVAVMYLGRIVEIGPADQVIVEPKHPYSQLLMRSIPSGDPGVAMLDRFVGEEDEGVGDASRPAAGCSFHPRCPARVDACRSVVPELRQLEDGRKAACHLLTPASAASPEAR